MAQLGPVKRVRFVREPDPHAPEHETLSIRLVGANGVSSLRANFAPLYDDQNQPLAAPFARWEELRAKYGGRDEAWVEEGMLVAPVAAARESADTWGVRRGARRFSTGTG